MFLPLAKRVTKILPLFHTLAASGKKNTPCSTNYIKISKYKQPIYNRYI